MSVEQYDDPDVRAEREARMFRVDASHEAAIVLRNELARLVPGRIITNRHPGSDHFHIEMDQDVAVALLALIPGSHHLVSEPAPLSPTRPTAWQNVPVPSRTPDLSSAAAPTHQWGPFFVTGWTCAPHPCMVTHVRTDGLTRRPQPRRHHVPAPDPHPSRNRLRRQR